MTDKRDVRSAMRRRRAAHVGEPLPVPPAFQARLSAGLVVATYVPIRGEADPAPFVRAAVAAGCTIALPHVVDHATPLRFLAWNGDDALASGPFGLHQPAADAPQVAPDIILTPLVAFDAHGHRVGQGAGHYDRAFAHHPDAWRIGIAWGFQQVARLVPDAWDVPLHAIATEQNWIVP